MNILHILPYERLIPPLTGGAQRCYYLLREMAANFDVTLVIFQDRSELSSGVNGFSVPASIEVQSISDDPRSPSIFDLLPGRVGPGIHYRFLRRSLRGPAEAALLKSYHIVRRILKEKAIDVVIFEHLSSMTLAPLVKRWSPSTTRILDAHNVDHELMRAEIESAIDSDESLSRKRKAYRAALRAESNLNRYVESFWACSENDRSIFESLNGMPGYVIPNGVDTTYNPLDDRDDKQKFPYLIFTGWMGTPANVDGIEYFVEAIWQRVLEKGPNLRLLVVGGGMEQALRDRLLSVRGVDLISSPADVREHFQRASVSLVPLRMGSGTRLKILQSMSLGNPVVSTSKGAEGLDVADGTNILLADDPASFADAVVSLISRRELFDKLRHNARSLVEERYDWRKIGERARQSLVEVVNRSFANSLHFEK